MAPRGWGTAERGGQSLGCSDHGPPRLCTHPRVFPEVVTSPQEAPPGAGGFVNFAVELMEVTEN